MCPEPGSGRALAWDNLPPVGLPCCTTTRRRRVPHSVGVTATNASTKTYVAEILGTTGSPVVLIPGGAAPSKRFFPHLEEELAGTHRVVLVDRQGTGRAVGLGPATLPSGSA